jgi:hypothetical protein
MSEAYKNKNPRLLSYRTRDQKLNLMIPGKYQIKGNLKNLHLQLFD